MKHTVKALRLSINNRTIVFFCLMLIAMTIGLSWIIGGRASTTARRAVSSNPVSSAGAGEFNRLGQSAQPLQPLRPLRSEAVIREFAVLGEKAAETGLVRVIVRLNPEFEQAEESRIQNLTSPEAIGVAQERLLNEITGFDATSVKRFRYVPFVAMRVNEAGLESLRASGRVAGIQEDGMLMPTAGQLSSQVQVSGNEAMSAGQTGASLTGNGQTVVVIDTGVDKMDQRLAGKVIEEACYSTNDPNQEISSLCPGGVTATTVANSALPCSGGGVACEQGTRLAGLIVGRGNDGNGVAPEAKVIAMQIFSKIEKSGQCPDGSGSCIAAFDSDLVSALERTYELRGTHSIAAVTMSLGRGRYGSDCDEAQAATKAMIDLLRGAGIATIVSSGSSGYSDALSAPACISTAISVGSTTEVRGIGERVDVVSNSAETLKLLAPGGQSASRLLKQLPQDGGNSMAAPRVAAAFALAREKAPAASVVTIATALAETGDKILDQRNGLTRPRIRIDRALDAINSTLAVPVKPEGLFAVTTSSTQIDLVWNDTANETSYKLQRKTSISSINWVTIATPGANTTSYQDTGLTPARTYYYQLIAVNSDGDSLASDVVRSTTQAVPLAPTNLTATVISASQINLSWADNATNEISYKVRRGTVPGGPYTEVATLPANTSTFQNVGLVSGTTYYFIVAAVNGGSESLPTNEASGATPEIIPAAPSGLVASTISPTVTDKLNLNWTDNSNNETGFRVERRTATGDFTQVGTILPANTNTYQSVGLVKNTQYFFRVIAVNFVGDSPASNIATATTPDTLPTAPSALVATVASASQINLRWTDNADTETSYEVRRSLTSGGPYTDIATLPAKTGTGTVTYEDKNLIDDTTYYYKVAAVNSGGEAVSNESNAKTLPLPDPPTGLVATGITASKIGLSWNDNSTIETGYKIRRSQVAGGPYTEVGQIGANATGSATFEDTGLTDSTRYYYIVVGINANGESESSNESSALTNSLPAKPTSVVATADSASQITLTWDDPTSDETGFEISRRSGSGPFALLFTTSSNATGSATYVDSDRLSGSQTYTYQVVTVDLNGKSTPAVSNEVTTPAGAPAPPSGLTAAAASGSSIQLTWIDNSATETEFRIERKNGVDWSSPVTFSVGANVTSYLDAGLTANTTYEYRVLALTAAGNGNPAYTSTPSNTASALPPLLPEAPTALAATTVSANRIDLAWTDNSVNESGFRIRRKAGVGEFSQVATGPAGAVAYSDTTVGDGTEFTYSVTAYNVAGDSAAVTGSATTPLPAPTILTVAPINATTLQLNWIDNTTNESNFRIERGTAAGGPYTVIAPTVAKDATSYQDSTGLIVDTNYYYRVTAYNAIVTSDRSNEGVSKLERLPVAPTGLNATTTSPTTVQLNWTDNSSNETGFRISRKTGSGGTFATIGTVTTTTFQDTGLSEGTEYFYQVTAFNISGDSTTSTEDSVITRSNAASNLTVTIINSTTLGLGWTDNSATESGYSIRRKTASSGYAEIAQLPANATTYTDSGVTSDTEYSYRVFAINSGGLSVASEEVSATPPTLPAAASTLTMIVNSSTKTTLTWVDNSTNETGFRIRRRSSITASWVTIRTVAANVVTWEDTTVSENTSYYYTVVAFNSGGEAASSNEATGTTPVALPNAPTGLTATTRSNTQVTLAWVDNTTNESSYKVERKTSVTAYNEIASIDANRVSYEDLTGLAGITYTYRVSAVNSAGIATSNEATTTTGVTPPTPTELLASVTSSSQVLLTWKDSGNTELGFRVRRRIGLTGTDTVAGIADPTSGTSGSFTDTGLKSGTTYYYSVTSYDNIGESQSTPLVFARTLDLFPEAPTGVRATAVSASRVDVSWTDNSDNESSFRVQRKTVGGIFADVSNELGPDITSYQDTTGLAPQTTYIYRVMVTNVLGSIPSISEATVTTPIAVPSAPPALTATIVSSFQVNLTWSDSSATETGYRIYRKKGASGSFNLYQSLGANAVSFQDIGLDEGETYSYRLVAFNSAGESPNVEATVTMPMLPNAPTVLVATYANANRINLSWTDNATNETGFRIFRRVGAGSFSLLTSISANTTASGTYSDTGLVPNTTYTYYLFAFNDGGSSDLSNNATATTPIIPPAPTGLIATAIDDQSIQLGWTFASAGQNGHSGFKILRRQTIDGSYTEVTPTSPLTSSSTQYLDTGLVSLRTYRYVVVAKTPTDESSVSNEASALTTDGPPDSPTDLVATIISPTRIKLDWTDNSANETTFKIERRDGTGPFAPLVDTLPNVTTYNDDSIVSGTSYSYRVKAYNSNSPATKDSANYTNVVTVTPPVTAPGAPTSLAAGVRTPTSINLTWVDNSSDEAGFVLSRKSGIGSYVVIATPPANSTSYNDTGLTEGTIYYYSLLAKNAAGESAPVETTQGLQTLPLGPTTLGVTISSFTSATLNWVDNSATEEAYQIRRKTGAGGTYSVLQGASLLPANTTSFIDTTLTSGTAYFYKVFALQGADESAGSNEVSVTLPSQPTAPSGLVAVTNRTTPVSQIDLTWTDNSNNETGFRIERKAGTTGTWATVITLAANVTSYQNTGLISGTVFYYRVLAVNAGGASVASNESFAATDGYPPNAPTNLVATSVSGTQINLTWKDNSDNEIGFRIQRRQIATGSPGSWLTVATIGANNLATASFQNTNLISGRTYGYRVISYNNDGDSISNEVEATTSLTVPAGPTELTATVISAFQINLAWFDNSGTETGYRIRRKTSLSAPYTTLIELAENTRSYSDTGLTANTTYYYQVIAFNTLGESLPSNDASGRTLLPPTAPSNLVATAASSTQINLSWTDNSTNETGFRIQRKTGVSGVWSEIATVAANIKVYQNSGLTPGVTYIYRVTAYNAVTDSAATAEASATTPVGIPSPPTNLQAIVVSFSQINLTWTDVSGNETGFLIRRKIGSGGTYADLATVPANTSSYQDTGLTSAVTYFYTVSAVSNSGNSAPSNEVSGTTTSGGSAVPGAPTNLVATATSSSQINLTWIDNASNETGFKIRRKAGIDGTWAQVATAGLNATSYSDTSLNSSQTYYYTVAATNAVGDSPLSNEVNATTQTGATTPIAPPGNLQVTALTPSSTQLNWIDTSAAESGFRIQRKIELAGSWANITTVPANTTSYQDSGLLSNATYYYRVTSFNATAESDPSNEHLVNMPVFDFDAVSNGQSVVSSVARNASKYYRIYVPSGATELLVETSGNNNANLYVQFGKQPTLTSNCRSEGTTSAEQCRLTAPGAGDWHIEVRGNSSTTSNFTLTATYQGGGTVTAPTAPTGLAAATVSSSQINLTWTDTSNNETNFRIRRRLGTSTTWALIATIGPNLNTYQDTGLTAGTTYSYYVTAFNVAGESANSNESSATTLNSSVTVPAAPSNLTATAASTTQINLSWTDNSSNETGFRIKRRASGATTSVEIGTVLQNVLSYQDSSLTPGTTYFYTIVAYNTGGASADSNEAGATTQSVNPTAPAGPSGLVAVAASAVQINIGWTDNSTNETGFRIRRKIGSNGAYSDLATVNANVTSYQDLGLIPGVTYYYVVLAFNANGNSVDSNEASANTTAPTPTLPAAPGGLVAAVISTAQINLSWTDNSTNETSFQIRRKTGSSGSYVDLATVVQNTTIYQDTGLTPGTTYFYQVFASNSAGSSTGSNEVSGTTTSAGGSLPAVPTGLLVTATSITATSLSWNDTSSNETGFRIQRKMGSSGIWVEVGTVGANVTIWQDSSLVSNAVYFYKVAAFNLIGESNYTNEMSVTIPVSAFTAIANGQTVSGSAKRNQAIYYRLSIPEGARDLVVESNSTPVTSLFVRYDKQPTQYAYNCNSEANNATQSCKLLTPLAGDWHIQIMGNTSTTSNFTMTASYQTGSGDVAPTAPSSLTGTPVSTTQINLSWTDGASNETGFRIRRKTGSTGTYAVIATLVQNVTIYQDTGLTAGTTYFYQVVAYNSVGESSSSNEFSTTTLTDSLTVPTAPSGLFATAVSSTQISLNWTDGASNETGFRVRRKTGSSGTYAIVATPGQNVTSYQDTGLTAGTTYFYQVVSYNSAGDSGSSNEASATTLTTAITVPISPSNLAATVASSTQINLSWTDGSSNETGFRVRRKTGSTGTYAVVSTLGLNITSYQDSGLTAGTTYFYQVVAYNSAGDSVSSNEVSATTTSSGGGGGVGTPTAPATLTATTLTTSTASLKWTDSSTNETGFRVQRKTGASGSWSDVATLSTNVTTWQDSGLLSNGTYFYRVVAFNANGDSSPSEEKSVTAPISSFTILNNGVTVSNSVTRSASRYYLITVPAGATDLTVETTSTYDSNLYVRFDRQPTLVSFNCRSVSTTPIDKCLITFPAAGDWHIQVLGNSITTSNFTLQATYTEGSKISPVPSPE